MAFFIGSRISSRPPPVRSREIVDPLHKIRKTLREHYRQKQEFYLTESPAVYDRALRRIFGGDPLRARGEPAATVVASSFNEVIEAGEHILMTERFRVYGGHDVIGVEWAGTLKNILAIASGALDAMKLGWNTRALLITHLSPLLTQTAV